jgi:hypothetical protein
VGIPKLCQGGGRYGHRHHNVDPNRLQIYPQPLRHSVNPGRIRHNQWLVRRRLFDKYDRREGDLNAGPGLRCFDPTLAKSMAGRKRTRPAACMFSRVRCLVGMTGGLSLDATVIISSSQESHVQKALEGILAHYPSPKDRISSHVCGLGSSQVEANIEALLETVGTVDYIVLTTC